MNTRFFPALILLAFLAGTLQGASFNGFPIQDIEQDVASRKASEGEFGRVVLFSYGLEALAWDVLSAGSTLDEYFDAQGFDYIGSVGRDAALLYQREKSKASFSVVELEARHKAAADLREMSRKQNEEIALVVFLAGGPKSVSSAASSLQKNARFEVTGTAYRESGGRIGLRVPPGGLGAALDALSVLPSVYTIQRGGGAKLLNDTARRIVQSGTTASGGETIWAEGIYGDGQVVAVLDTGGDPLNCYLAEADGSLPPVVQGTAQTAGDPTRRKIIAYDMLYSGDDPADGLSAYESNGHGTYVAGNALASKGTGGDSLSDASGVSNGVAPGAQLIVQDGGFQVNNCADLAALGCPLIDLTPALDQAVFQGAHIHNNSWGDRENFTPQNTYTAACVDMDDITWRHPHFLIVCAAGNQGSGNDTVGSPSVAKNVISAAGTRNPQLDQIISFSSTGWADDGRIKPDLAAPASTETSSWDSNASAIHCSTASVAGTSMASPITAGSAALARQYFTEGWYPGGSANPADEITTPSAALLKATLINGAAAVGSEPVPPSRRQGWGRVYLDNSLYFDGDDRRLVIEDQKDHFQSSADVPFEITIQCNGSSQAGDLTVTLVYSDYPATAGANPALVNDLDLIVETPGGATIRGNNFDSAGMSVASGAADTKNNVEKVVLPGDSGVYTVRIDPSLILQPAQGYALAIGGDVEPAATAGVPMWILY